MSNTPIKKLSEREAALKAYQACASAAERAELYWRTPVLQEIFSATTHPRPGGIGAEVKPGQAGSNEVKPVETRRIL